MVINKIADAWNSRQYSHPELWSAVLSRAEVYDLQELFNSTLHIPEFADIRDSINRGIKKSADKKPDHLGDIVLQCNHALDDSCTHILRDEKDLKTGNYCGHSIPHGCNWECHETCAEHKDNKCVRINRDSSKKMTFYQFFKTKKESL